MISSWPTFIGRPPSERQSVNSALGRSVECPAARLACYLDDTRRIPSARKIESVSFGMYVGSWHVCDMPTSSSNVRSQGQSGRHLLELSSSDSDPKATSFDVLLQNIAAASLLAFMITCFTPALKIIQLFDQ
jgi:hypothetical protein